MRESRIGVLFAYLGFFCFLIFIFVHTLVLVAAGLALFATASLILAWLYLRAEYLRASAGGTLDHDAAAAP